MNAIKPYIPNTLTLLRIPFAAGFLAAHVYDWLIVAVVLAICGCVTDYLDGYLARRWKVPSAFGKIADAYADKAICWTLTITTITIYGSDPVLVAALVVQAAYDGGLSFVRYVLGQANIPVNQYAKWKTTLLMAGFIALYATWATAAMLGHFAFIVLAAQFANVLAYAALIAAMALALASIATYLQAYKLGWLIPYPLRLIIR